MTWITALEEPAGFHKDQQYVAYWIPITGIPVVTEEDKRRLGDSNE